jgi:hypothetical protein
MELAYIASEIISQVVGNITPEVLATLNDYQRPLMVAGPCHTKVDIIQHIREQVLKKEKICFLFS